MPQALSPNFFLLQPATWLIFFTLQLVNSSTTSRNDLASLRVLHIHSTVTCLIVLVFYLQKNPWPSFSWLSQDIYVVIATNATTCLISQSNLKSRPPPSLKTPLLSRVSCRLLSRSPRPSHRLAKTCSVNGRVALNDAPLLRLSTYSNPSVSRVIR